MSTDQEGRNWIKKVELWMGTKHLRGDRAKISQVGVLLKNNAELWFNQLEREIPALNDTSIDDGEEGIIRSWEQFKRRFLEKFKKRDGDNWRGLNDLFEYKQRDDQSTEEFVSEMQQRAVAAKAPPETVRCAVLGGLRPFIKNMVLQHDVDKLEDVVRWGQIAEKLEPSKTDDTGIAKMVKVAMMEAISEAKQDGTVAAVTQRPFNQRDEGGDEGRPYRQTRQIQHRDDEMEDRNWRSNSWRQQPENNRTTYNCTSRGRGRGQRNWTQSRGGTNNNWRSGGRQQQSGVQ